MVEYLNDDVTYRGTVTASGLFVADGGLIVGPGGVRVGDEVDSWSGQARVQVADKDDRDDLVDWRQEHNPITPTQPLLVWRADGSSTGVNEMTTNGTDWYAESASAGDIEMTLAAAAPFGWQLMQGQVLANAEANYPALWATAAPTLRQGSGLLIPDMRGRAAVGAGQGSGLSLRNLGDQFGAETVALTESQLPAHKHGGTTNGADRSLNHYHHFKMGAENGSALSGDTNIYELHDPNGGYNHATGATKPTASNTDINLNHLHSFTTDEAGQNQAHQNVQPSLAVNYKVKV